MNESFDDLSRALAVPTTRRRVLGVMAGTMAASVLGVFKAGKASAETCGANQAACGNTCCNANTEFCCPGAGAAGGPGPGDCVPTGTVCCPGSFGGPICNPGQVCSATPPNGICGALFGGALRACCNPADICGNVCCDGCGQCINGVCCEFSKVCTGPGGVATCCAAGSQCNGNTGTCFACAPGTTACGNTCCPAGFTCGANQTCTCNAPNFACGTACCTSGQNCVNGACVTPCPTGTTTCGTACCSASQSCVNGTCVTNCPAGQFANAAGACVCNGTGAAPCNGVCCAAPQTCVSGVCT
ncbi:MAG: hypothetical protein LC792_18635, partial [Actinobacteria bacterium]|nr:hypothetical protein [Actinomycetota bacterium]